MLSVPFFKPNQEYRLFFSSVSYILIDTTYTVVIEINPDAMSLVLLSNICLL